MLLPSYITNRSLIPLFLALALSSLFYSLTFYLATGSYQALTGYFSTSKNLLIIYDPRSSTPFTGLVSLDVIDRLENITGVLALSPEMLAPCTVNGHAAFARGITENFEKVEDLPVEPPGIDYALAGWKLADRLNLEKGSIIYVAGVLSDTFIVLKVKDIIETNTPLDDEIVVDLTVAQWLRGTKSNTATLVKVLVDPERLDHEKIREILAAEAAEQTVRKTGMPIIGRPASISRAAELIKSTEFMERYVSRYGFGRETIIALSILAFLLSSCFVYGSADLLKSRYMREIRLIRALGATKRRIYIDLLLKTLPYLVAASFLGFAATPIILNMLGCKLLLHTITFKHDLIVLALNAILNFSILSVSFRKLK